MERTRSLPPGFIPHTVLFPLDTSIPILSTGIPSFLIKYCNAFAPAYYDSIWFVTRTRHSRSNLLNRIFITRGRRTVYSSSAWLIKETVHPLPSHYNKNKHSLRGFISAKPSAEKKRAEWRVTSVFALRKPWCTSNSFVCALLNVPRIPKRRAPLCGALLFGGPEGIRTHDLSDANRTLSQLSYRPK